MLLQVLPSTKVMLLYLTWGTKEQGKGGTSHPCQVYEGIQPIGLTPPCPPTVCRPHTPCSAPSHNLVMLIWHHPCLAHALSQWQLAALVPGPTALRQEAVMDRQWCSCWKVKHPASHQASLVPTSSLRRAAASRAWQWAARLAESPRAACFILLKSITFPGALEEGAGCQQCHPAQWCPEGWLCSAWWRSLSRMDWAWECGMLWGPGALLWGHCKLMMYITRLHWRMGALECNKVRTSLLPGAVVPVEEMHPSTAG